MENQIAGNGPADAGFTMTQNPTNYMFTFRVEVVSLDEFEFETKIDCLFVDAEGAELEILKGARNIISSMKPKIFVETHPFLVLGIDLAVVEYLESFWIC
jgi:FkbM family methyltransferase